MFNLRYIPKYCPLSSFLIFIHLPYPSALVFLPSRAPYSSYRICGML